MNLNNTNDELKSEDEIDLVDLYHVLYRNKTLIAKSTFAGVILSVFLALVQQRTWQGEFQIVLEESQGSGMAVDSKLNNLAGLGGGMKKQLKTQVGVLKSPSILMNIFEYVKDEKSKNNSKSSEIRFNDWKSQLKIELEKDTAILNLSYRDKNKEIILPVLNKISYAYQNYSGKKRRRDLELGLKYFDEQIDIYREKNEKSIRSLQQFEKKHDLSSSKSNTRRLGQSFSLPSPQQGSQFNLDPTTHVINVVREKEEATNNIRDINVKLQLLDEASGDPENIIGLSRSFILLGMSPQSIDDLDNLDKSIVLRRTIYKDNDYSIIQMLRKRESLITLLELNSRNFLLSIKNTEDARLNASERPEGVLIKYRQLLNNASRDKSILDQLEIRNRALLLEKARAKDPWELITEPTLLPNAVAPKRKQMVTLGFLISLFLGSGVAIFINKRKDIIYSTKEINTFGKWPFISELKFKDINLLEESIYLLVNGPLSNNLENFSILVVGEPIDSLIAQLQKSFKKLLPSREIIVTADLREALCSSNLLILTTLGISTGEQLKNIKNKLEIQKSNILGVLAIVDQDYN